jgi:prevent-host-death family protein
VAEVTVRELRNDGGRVLDRVERGESLTVTRDGHPVAELRPEMRIVVNWTEELKRLVPAIRRLSP